MTTEQPSGRQSHPVRTDLGLCLRLCCTLSFVLVTALTSLPAARGAQTTPEVASWLAAQTNVHTWSADFVQTRALKTLTQPLTATGHIWFQAPNRFRWELGHPAQTVAVRAPAELLILYPRLKRVERFPLGGQQSGPWRDALALLETGFPRSQSELEARYQIVSQSITAQTCQVILQPKSVSARRMMPQIKIEFDVKDYSLRGTELQFADGSTMRNDFKNAVLNPQLDAKLFDPEIPGDFKVVEPLKKP
jgi:outer membrane lipoprotein-sorting protein